MSYVDKINELIEAVKQEPNGLARNKVVSHLNDARVWAIELLEQNANRAGQPPPKTCTCLAGVRDTKCPVHGGNVV